MYCTIDNVTDKMTKELVAQLSNDETAKTIDFDVVNVYIDSATDIINGYLRGRYNLPLSGTHTLLKDIAVEIVRFNLIGRRDTPNDFEKKLYDDAITTLKDIARGVIQLDDGGSNTDKPVTILATKHKPMLSRHFINKY